MAIGKFSDDDKNKKSTSSGKPTKTKSIIDAEATKKELEKIAAVAEREAEKALMGPLKKFGAELKDTVKESFKDSMAAWGKQTLTAAADNMLNAARVLTQGVDSFLSSYSQYYSNIQTRMMGTGRTYESMLSNIQRGVSGSRSTNVTAVISKLNDLVSQGISYNVEQRAFLGTISDKIAATFDAANGTLLQLIRINRNDSTAAYLGMESALTEYLNGQFGDTSYFAQNLNESVSSAIYQATSQLGAKEGAAFEYVVQKWLGSFYASGMNTETISKLAAGIGYLGSGDVSSLTSNTELNNLMAMAANYSGQDYSSLLTRGLSSSSVNKLLQGIYQQGYAMAQSSDQVAKSQYAKLFGMTISDLTALLNLSTSDLNSIADNMLNYSGLIAKTEYELSQVKLRTSIAERVENALMNAYAETGEAIATNVAAYTTKLLSEAVGTLPIAIPYLGTLDIAKITQAGVVGWGLFSQLGDVLSALASDKTLSLSSLASADTTIYGTGMVTGVAGPGYLSRGSGRLSYIGSGSSSDLIGAALTNNDSNAQAVADNTKVVEKTTADIYTLFAEGIMYNLISTIASAASNMEGQLQSMSLRTLMPDV